ncbi:MAG: hypothetical protein AAF620_17815 [Bacteroidota bacterium]
MRKSINQLVVQCILKPILRNVLTVAILSSTVFFTSCNDDNDPQPSSSEDNLGFALFTTGGGALLTFSDTLFSGTINPANFVNPIQFADANRVLGVGFGGGFYTGFNQTLDIGIQKFTENDLGEFEDAGFISIGEGGGLFDFASQSKGYYIDELRNDQALQTFDPSTMQRTGEVDFSSSVAQFANNDSVVNITMNTFVQAAGNYVFTQINFLKADGQNVFDSTFVVAINSTTDLVENVMIYPQAIGIDEGLSKESVTEDSNGDVYFLGSTGPLTSQLILRVKAGTTSFDMSFGTNGLANLEDIAPNFAGTGGIITLGGGQINDGKIYIRMNEEDASFANIFTLESFAWEVDLNTLTGTKIQGIPGSLALANTLNGTTIIDGKAYFPVANDDFQGYYTYDLTTGEVVKAIELETGRIGAIAKL